MDFLEVKQLVDHCTEIGLIDPNVLTRSSAAIAQMIDLTVETVRKENIETLLTTTASFTNFSTPDEAILIAIGVAENLMDIDQHLARWFLDVLLRDATSELRAEMAAAFQGEMYRQARCIA